MTDRFPRAPRLPTNSCIITPALLESAQRVFLWHSQSPIHWMDLSTLIDAVLIYDSFSLPMLHVEYAGPLLGPLQKSDLVDPWYPEAAIMNGPILGSKEDVWKSETVSNEYMGAAGAIRILSGWWPDRNFDALSNVSKKAIDGIAANFAEISLSLEDDEMSVLLWGAYLRNDRGSTYETTAANWLSKAVQRIKDVPSQERTSFSVPHQSTMDVYNEYANNLRTLANDNHAIIIKSLMEEPYFDSVSLENAARDTLHLLLKSAFDGSVTQQVGKFITSLPISPFAAIALSRCSNINEVLTIAIELRDEFKPYRATLQDYRQALVSIEEHQTMESLKEIRKMETSFGQALTFSLKRIGAEYGATTNVFNPYGAEKLAKSLMTGEYASVLDRAASQLIDLMKGWAFMNYGGVYNIVSQFPKVQMLGKAAHRLINKELDQPTVSLVLDAATKVAEYHRLQVPSLK